MSLLHINVNDHTEKKNGLTYLSWAWAWAECLKADPGATWGVVNYGDKPCMYVGETAMVHTHVTINGLRRECMLPVMDHRNKAIQNPDAFAINTAIMRCMTKAISMHGLGLYIYAGEDVPQAEDAGKTQQQPAPPTTQPKTQTTGSATRIAFDNLPADWKDYLTAEAPKVVDLCARVSAKDAAEYIKHMDLDEDQHAGLFHLLDSKTRSAINALTKGRVTA